MSAALPFVISTGAKRSGGTCCFSLPSDLTALNKSHRPHLCHPDPDFLYVAPSMTACAAFSEESRIRFANAHKLNRKSGGAKPRDLQFSLSWKDIGLYQGTALAGPQRPTQMRALAPEGTDFSNERPYWRDLSFSYCPLPRRRKYSATASSYPGGTGGSFVVRTCPGVWSSESWRSCSSSLSTPLSTSV